MTSSMEWHRMPVGDLCDLTGGSGFGPKEWSDTGLPIIRIQNLNGSRRFNHFGGDPDPSDIVEPGDLLFAWAGSKGVSFGPTVWKGPRGVLNQHIYRVRPRPGVDKLWLQALLEQVTHRIESKAHGFKKGLVHVRKADITEQVWPVPTLAEQRLIVADVERWDRACELLDEICLLKGRLRAELGERLFTGRLRFKEFVARPWHLRKLSEFFDHYSTANGDAARIPLTCSKILGIIPQSERFERRLASRDLSRYKVVRRGDLVFDPMLLWDASIAFLEATDEGVVSPAYSTFRFNESTGSMAFFRALLKSRALINDYRRLSRGTNKRRKKVLVQDFLAISRPLPEVDEQNRIGELLSKLDLELALLRRQRNLFGEQRRIVVHKLLTGEVRLRTDN